MGCNTRMRKKEPLLSFSGVPGSFPYISLSRVESHFYSQINSWPKYRISRIPLRLTGVEVRAYKRKGEYLDKIRFYWKKGRRGHQYYSPKITSRFLISVKVCFGWMEIRHTQSDGPAGLGQRRHLEQLPKLLSDGITAYHIIIKTQIMERLLQRPNFKLQCLLRRHGISVEGLYKNENLRYPSELTARGETKSVLDASCWSFKMPSFSCVAPLLQTRTGEEEMCFYECGCFSAFVINGTLQEILFF